MEIIVVLVLHGNDKSNHNSNNHSNRHLTGAVKLPSVSGPSAPTLSEALAKPHPRNVPDKGFLRANRKFHYVCVEFGVGGQITNSYL